MNSILHTFSALLAGAFLNLGLVRFAEWFDQACAVDRDVFATEIEMARPCVMCEVPAEFALRH